jgi:hypothetical protein
LTINQNADLQVLLSHRSLELANPMKELVMSASPTLYDSFPPYDFYIAINEQLVGGVARRLIRPFSIRIREKETIFEAFFVDNYSAMLMEAFVNELQQQFCGLSFIKVDVQRQESLHG